MISNHLEKAVRRIALAASGAALLALSSPWALAAAPDAAQKQGLQLQFKQNSSTNRHGSKTTA